jgi:hypothetical protein
MATKQDITAWVRESLLRFGGRASLIEVARDIWKHHESDLRSSGDLFYTWQYDMRWSADSLRRDGIMKAADTSPQGIWELA